MKCSFVDVFQNVRTLAGKIRLIYLGGSIIQSDCFTASPGGSDFSTESGKVCTAFFQTIVAKLFLGHT